MNFIHESNRVYLNDEVGHMVAVVTFPPVKEGVVKIEHTFVDTSLRGQGVAGKLMEEVAAHLRANNLKAMLSCSYAIKWFQEHPECADLVVKL